MIHFFQIITIKIPESLAVMQQTRRYILDILKTLGDATVDDIVAELQRRCGKKITAVTVRHHITCLQKENLVATPQLKHRSSPGRPQHVYTLTESALAQFPNNYQQLALSLLTKMQQTLPPQGVNVILEGVAKDMAQEAGILEAPLEQRLDMAVEYLNARGYNAYWEAEAVSKDFVLYTNNCPYHQVAHEERALCDMDMHLVANLLGVVPRRKMHIMAGESACAYEIPSS
jgi:predicted ArsR family transcriptional regulator